MGLITTLRCNDMVGKVFCLLLAVKVFQGYERRIAFHSSREYSLRIQYDPLWKEPKKLEAAVMRIEFVRGNSCVRISSLSIFSLLLMPVTYLPTGMLVTIPVSLRTQKENRC